MTNVCYLSGFEAGTRLEALFFDMIDHEGHEGHEEARRQQITEAKRNGANIELKTADEN